MAKNKIGDLRNHLFDVLERVKSINDPDASEADKIDIEQAKTIVDVAEQIIETFKVEVQAVSIISKSPNATLLVASMQNSGLLNSDIKELPSN